MSGTPDIRDSSDRTLHGNCHTERCRNIDCPCYQEGSDVRAHNHWSMLQWFAAKAPDLLVRALTEVSPGLRPEMFLLDGHGGEPHIEARLAVDPDLAFAALTASINPNGPRLVSSYNADRGQDSLPLPTQAQTLDWVRSRWPDRCDPIWRAAKLGEEAGEVLGAVIKLDEGRTTKADIEQETAQVVICAMALAESVGFDLFAAVAHEYRRCTDFPEIEPMRAGDLRQRWRDAKARLARGDGPSDNSNSATGG